MNALNTLSEKELFSLIAEGNEPAFKQVYNKYDDLLFPFLFRLTKNKATAEEIMQETFLRIWLYRDLLTDVQSPRAYIYRIASNIAQRWVKQHLPGFSALEEVPGYHSEEALTLQPHHDFISKEIQQQITVIITAMPEQRRKIYQLHREESYTYKEIALLLHIAPSTVRNSIAAAIKHIREKLESMGYSRYLLLLYLLKVIN